MSTAHGYASDASYDSDFVRQTFVTGLVNAHALEKEALALLNRQLDRIESYPDLASRLRQHVDETNNQIGRLDAILERLGESPSTLKDTALNIIGNLAALGHTVMPDEILKNTFASYAFENFEAASYKSLITMAEAGGFGFGIEPLRTSLGEELAMAKFLDDNNASVTRRFLQFGAAGAQAKR